MPWPVLQPARRRGVTLIELLCAIAIIVLLATLLLGPAARALKRARAMQWGDFAETQTELVVGQLQNRFGGRNDHPVVTLEGLEALGVVGPTQLRFLHDRRVTFIPFAGADPDEKVILAVQIESGFLTSAGTITVTKARLKPPG